jgi:hypothetical protein
LRNRNPGAAHCFCESRGNPDAELEKSGADIGGRWRRAERLLMQLARNHALSRNDGTNGSGGGARNKVRGTSAQNRDAGVFEIPPFNECLLYSLKLYVRCRT